MTAVVIVVLLLVIVALELVFLLQRRAIRELQMRVAVLTRLNQTWKDSADFWQKASESKDLLLKSRNQYRRMDPEEGGADWWKFADDGED